MDPARERLQQFVPDPEAFQPQADHVERWYTGEHLDIYPRRSQMRARGIERVLKGWVPAEPIITDHTRVLAIGSCFASNFILWLADRGFNRNQADSPYNTLLKYGSGFESVAVVAQQFRWAFGDFDPGRALWVTQTRELVAPTDDDRAAVRESLANTDVLIITLGLSEVWYDKTTNEPLWRAIPRRLFDADRHAFKVLSLAETTACFEQINSIRQAFLPDLRIVFTVSPIRLRATFRPVSAVTANSVSKAILRAGLDEFLRSHPDQLGMSYFYFPSYELVTDVFTQPFVEDNRHLYDAVTGQVLELFARTYTNFDVGSATAYVPGDPLLRQLEELQATNAQLNEICVDRQRVIDDLAHTAAERLALIEKLHAQCQEYQAMLQAKVAAAGGADSRG